jgi:glucose/arabinose dehydrogenase
MNPRGLALAALLAAAAAPQEKAPGGKRWSDMDYGPVMAQTFEVKGPARNLAFKGLRVRLGPDGASMLFDADLLRWSAGWLKGGLDWKSVVYDGSHQTHPKVLGETLFANPMLPGCSPDGRFEDPRPLPYGPLPPDRARFRGHYLHGERVVLAYRVGAADVLELAGLERSLLTRTIEIGKSPHDLVFQVAAGRPPVACLGAPLDRGDPDHVRLRVAAASTPIRVKILYGTESAAGAEAEPLEPLTRGGPPRWPQKIETQGTLGAEDGPYAVDVLALPTSNPWRAWMRPGGFDFFADGTRAAVCTWSGDVWIVEGIGPRLGTLTWRRIAAGLFQPLGLRILQDRIYVACRDQVARLNDLNADGEIDHVECFNGDHQVTEHFHEFAMGLQADAEGNLYYAKAARHALKPVVPQHGTLIKVSADGARSEIVCNGFRAPNGVGLGPRGELVASDQEGHWIPANRINLLRAGGFYGNQWSYHEGKDPETYDPPIVWLPPKVDRSPAEQLWVSSDAWGPFKGSLLSTSYGTGRLFLIPYEVADGVPQGAAVAFPLRFPTGVMRGRFHPGDGQLYLCGLVGWSSDSSVEGGLYRVRYTGKPVRMPLAVHAAKDSIELTFTSPLDRGSAEDVESWSIRQWNYRWTGNYGSKAYKPSQPDRQGEDEVEVRKVELRGDRTVVLAIPDLKPVMQMEIGYSLRGADGALIKDRIWLTLNGVR